MTMTSERRPSGTTLPAPELDLAQRIVAFVDFAGPCTSADVAAHFGVLRSMVDWHLTRLRGEGYVRYDPTDGLRTKFEATSRWNPDDGTGGARQGPRTPYRRFHDTPLFSDAEPIDRILRRPK